MGSWALIKAGGEEVACVDIGDQQELIYKQQPFFKGGLYIKMDAREFNLEVLNEHLKANNRELIKPGDIDVILISSPCTSISGLNLYRTPFADSNFLLLETARFIEIFKPKLATIIENVPALSNSVEMEPLLTELKRSIYATGNVNICLDNLNAKHFETPQSRLRCVLASTDLPGKITFPAPTTKDYDALKLNRIIPSALGYCPGISRTKIMDEHNRIIGKSDKWYSSDRIIGAITATGGERILDSIDGKRSLTIDELKKLFGIEEFTFEGVSYAVAHLLIGNGIAVPFLQRIVEHLLRTLNNGHWGDDGGDDGGGNIDGSGGDNASDIIAATPEQVQAVMAEQAQRNRYEPHYNNDTLDTKSNTGSATETTKPRVVQQDSSTDKTVYDTGVLYHGDCLELFKFVEPHSIDMILCDLPYGTTGHEWDKIIPLDELWRHYKRVLKLRGVVVLTAGSPFNGKLISSNREWFKYDLVWVKNNSTNFANANKQPMRKHENVLVFYKEAPTYNPQGLITVAPNDTPRKYYNNISRNSGGMFRVTTTPNYQNEGKIPIEGSRQEKSTEGYGLKWRGNGNYKPEFTNYPDTILKFDGVPSTERKHPSQKPQALFEYLIRTFTNEGDTVLDNCVGAGTTAAACLVTGNRFIVMEKEQKYYDITKIKIEDTIRKLKERNTDK